MILVVVRWQFIRSVYSGQRMPIRGGPYILLSTPRFLHLLYDPLSFYGYLAFSSKNGNPYL